MSISRETLEIDDDGTTADVEVETLDPVAFAPNAALSAAIAAGHVKTKDRVVEVKQKDKAGNIVKVFRQSYTQCFAKNEAGALALPGVDGDADTVWTFVSARADANVYQPIYVRLRNASQGPEKILGKMEKLVSGLSEAQKAALREQLVAAGLL